MSKEYQPMDCNVYDHLEIHAMHHSWVEIELRGRDKLHYTKIRTIQAKAGVEYAVLLDDTEMRLDDIVSFRAIKSTDGSVGFLLEMLDYHHWANLSIVDTVITTTDEMIGGLVSHILLAIYA